MNSIKFAPIVLTSLFAIGVAFFLFQSCEKEKACCDTLKEFDVMGNPKSMKIKAWKAVDKFGKIEKGETTTILNFLYVEFNANGCPSYFEQPTFDDKHKNGENDKIKVIYDGAGCKKVAWEWSNAKGKFKGKNIYKYSDDELIENAYYNEKGELIWRENYKYDKNRCLIQKLRYDGSGKLEWRNEYSCDSRGNQIENLSFKETSDNATKTTYEYNDRNKKIKDWTHFSVDDIIITYTYDELGNEIEHYFNGGSVKSLSKYEYIYDRNKNWIKKICFSDGKAETIIERDIEYY